MDKWLTLAITLIQLWMVVSYSSFRQLIPNGYHVQDSCGRGKKWHGVGHLNPSGGGTLNPFGQDFLKEGKQWTKRLCSMDSDHDGITNGQELGDPNCIWTTGRTPERTTNITHPGICEPVGSKNCSYQRNSVACQKENDCPAKSEAGIQYFDAVFPRTKVPAHHTTYFCKTFQLPDDKEYHIVAIDPVINNPYLVHHMDLYACTNMLYMRAGEKPFDCMSMEETCKEMIAGWALGESGKCMNKMSGIKFGRNGLRFIRVQIHWNNEGSRTNLYDNSGLRLYYTEKLRKYDLGQLIAGQLFLRIPPKKEKFHVHPSICSSECTKSFLPHPVNVTGVNLHMHFAGKSIYLEQYRDGKRLRVLAKDDPFDYNNPDYFTFDPPLQVYPGDELRTQCIYQSMDRNEMTYDGYGAYDEMCYAFIYYYPKVSASGYECATLERHSNCELERMKDYSYLYAHNYGDCNLRQFEKDGYVHNVLHSCGYHLDYCTRRCKRAVDAMFSHYCMVGVLGEKIREAHMEKDIAIATSVWDARRLCKNMKFSASFASYTAPNTEIVLTVTLLIALVL